MIPSRIRAGTAAAMVVALVACGDRKPPPPRMAEVMPNLPLPPQARFLGRSSGEDALQVTVETPHPHQRIAAYYRTMLNQGEWKLVNEARDPDGALVFLAEQDGPPLWVRISPAADTNATVVEFSGARTAAQSKPAS